LNPQLWNKEMAALIGRTLDSKVVRVALGRPISGPIPIVETPEASMVEYLDLEVAYSKERRIRGLAGRDEMACDGMLFLYEQPQSRAFDLTQMRFPIQVLWFDQAGLPLVGTSTSSIAKASAPYSYVIETVSECDYGGRRLTGFNQALSRPS
jgi:uncharacterized membrane protein (UPF0127 family)